MFNLENFLLNGFSVIDNIDATSIITQELLSDVEISTCSDIKAIPDNIYNRIIILEEQVYNQLCCNFNCVIRVGTLELIKGIDYLSTDWHTDNNEGFNCNVIIYMDKMPNNEGILHIKNDIEEFAIVPNVGMIVAINHTKNFKHKVTPSEILRRRIEFKYQLPL